MQDFLKNTINLSLFKYNKEVKVNLSKIYNNSYYCKSNKKNN